MSSETVTVCGSLSKYPVGLGRAMHEAGYRALGLPYVYVPFGIEDVKGALVGMRALGIRGLGVSMPFKLEIREHLDVIDARAQQIGAVNTVVNDAGVLTGYNTDADGAVRALEEVTALGGKQIVVVGAGGAARAVAFGLVAAGARVRIVNRTAARARALAQNIVAQLPDDSAAVAAGPLDDLAFAGADIVVQATSAPMADVGGVNPIPVGAISAACIVMDIVYKPLRTRVIVAAEAAGATVVDGSRMLLHQACRQFELYTGRPAPRAAMDEALRAQIQ
jgi:shikimate dehydrogenase